MEAGRGRAGVGLRVFVHGLLPISSDSYISLERTYEYCFFVFCIMCSWFLLSLALEVLGFGIFTPDHT